MFVYLFATLDTKGAEAAFVRDRLEALGVRTRLVDVGCVGEPTGNADIASEIVFRAAGTSRAQCRDAGDRGAAVNAAAAGAARIAAEAYVRGDLAGVLAIGGSAGTTIGTAAMRALPIGVPKLMVSTLASGQVRPYVGDKDILMLNSVVDIAGLNRVSRRVLASAAAAMAGLVTHRLAEDKDRDKPLIAATMFGVTTPCVQHARGVLEAAGYEVLVFHATGAGGQAMESLIADGIFAGVLDITTTELADELVGGVLSAGPDRLTAAAWHGIPQVVSVGALDMVNFGPRETVPAKFAARQFHVHNASVTLMRTTREENELLGAELGRKVAASRGPAAIYFPMNGVSALDCEGQVFNDAAARFRLRDGIRAHCGDIEFVDVSNHINDPKFAEIAANGLLQLIDARRGTEPLLS